MSNKEKLNDDAPEIINSELKDSENVTIPENQNENNTDNLTENNGVSDSNASQEVEKESCAEEKLSALNDKYLRLSAEFDNYRKRTLKERMELIKSAGEDIFINFLPVINNLERAKKAVDDAKEIEPVKEGIDLIFKSIYDFLSLRGLKEIEAVGKDFDTDIHEALTKIPAPEESMKGKVVVAE
jgi:molecular chaperone GrpE